MQTTGLGYYLRTSDSDFVASDGGWVRITKGPFSLATYNPVALTSFVIGTAAADGTTGTVEFRNVKVEVGDSFTTWCAAPEDLHDLQTRMSTAESTITQHSSQIALKVNQATYDSEKVYRGTSAPTTLYINMLWLDTSLSPPVLKRWTGSAWVTVAAEEVHSSGIYITPNDIRLTTENFILQ